MYDPDEAVSRLLRDPTIAHDQYSQRPYPQSSYTAIPNDSYSQRPYPQGSYTAIPHDPYSQHPYPQGSYPAYQNLRPIKKLGCFQRWFATSSSLQPTANIAEVKWGIHWSTPVSIVLLLLLGTASTVGHHYFYSLLHHTTVGNEARQRWTLWIGSSFSFLTKVTLTAALGLSRTQWVWLTLRKKWLTMEGIDALFGVIHDPRFFTNRNMLKRAKAATAIAVAMWIFPIAAILTPGAISVDTFPLTGRVPCSVRSLLFPFDTNSTAKFLPYGGIANDSHVISLANWDLMGTTLEQEPGTTIQVVRVYKLSAFTGLIASPSNLPPATSSDITTLGKLCGENCTYSVEFLGPAITCTNFTSWSTLSKQNISEWMGSAYYGATIYLDGKRLLVEVISSDATMDLIILECQSSTARYTVQHVIQERRFLEPIITKVESVELPGLEQAPIYPDTTYLPHLSLMNAVSRIAQGKITIGLSVETEIALTPLFDDLTINVTNVGPAIERMAHKMIASLLAFEMMLNGTAYTLDVSAMQQTECTTTKYVVLYVYSTVTLVFIYGLAVACALVTSVAGFYALGQNGMASTHTVSAIIRTTRNTTLDELIVGGSCLGGHPMSKELKTVELQFGALRGSEKRPASFAMGVRGEISPIKRD